MLKAAGITAEYNPLHNGHVYHIKETRRITGCDAVVVAMSGDFVQRGEPAFMDKWVRTRHALLSGADLVLEIPAFFCLGNAGQYADAAVKILEATGRVSHISFGSESGDAGTLKKAAETLKENGPEITERIRSMKNTGFSYPAARALAYSELKASANGAGSLSDDGAPQYAELPVLANDILAVEYIKALNSAEPVVIKRRGGSYDAGFDAGAEYQSSSAVRSRILAGNDVSEYVPGCTAESLKECHLTGTDLDGWFDILRYAVLSAGRDQIEDCPSGEEGLAFLLKSGAACAESWTDLVSRIKSKRYTYTRISRLCMQLVLGMSRSRYGNCSPGYIRVLGFNDCGRALLAEMRNEGCAELPVIINVNKSAEGLDESAASLLRLDIHAADIYNLVTKGEVGSCSDHLHPPVMIHK